MCCKGDYVVNYSNPFEITFSAASQDYVLNWNAHKK